MGGNLEYIEENFSSQDYRIDNTLDNITITNIKTKIHFQIPINFRTTPENIRFMKKVLDEEHDNISFILDNIKPIEYIIEFTVLRDGINIILKNVSLPIKIMYLKNDTYALIGSLKSRQSPIIPFDQLKFKTRIDKYKDAVDIML